jgi:hypothetical protein
MVLAFMLISPFRGTGQPTWLGAGEALLGLGRVWRERKQIQARRRAPLGELALALTWSPSPLLRRGAAFKRSKHADRRHAQAAPLPMRGKSEPRSL